MSHFTVAVFTKSGTEKEIARLLAPYDEATEDKKYLEFEPDEEADFDEERGERGWWVNPNAKWDWWVVGGRWSGLLTLKPGAGTGSYGERSWTNEDAVIPENMVDSALVRDVDFAPDATVYAEAVRFWELYVDHQPLKDGETMPGTWYRPEYFSDQYGTKENYAISQSEFSTYAFVSSDGTWHGEARMGWFGMDDNTREKRETQRTALADYIANHPDEFITIVDCHI